MAEDDLKFLRVMPPSILSRRFILVEPAEILHVTLQRYMPLLCERFILARRLFSLEATQTTELLSDYTSDGVGPFAARTYWV